MHLASPRRLVLAPLAAFALLASVVACGPSAPPPTTPPGEPGSLDAGGALPPTTPATPTGALKKPGEAAVGDRSVCPVSGEEFTVTASSPKVEHEGKTYYFCCSGCENRFKADPKKFLEKT